ncbi:MAG: isopentenyl-diphosphate delta-isomerase, type 1 [Flavipsychrobacter sp.]|nr:isopentenyl-diphosphate delta-isomerase, type 1 [Flavipsychrobacter sp.]
MEQVILVDEQDAEVGIMEKMQAHKDGKLHRAISVFIFNSRNELLLQQRADGKYHSAGLWSNTCCSHPMPGEATAAAATRRLQEEMGMKCRLEKSFTFIYKAYLDHCLTEFEYDHVYMGITDEEPIPNPAEVAAWKYVDSNTLQADVLQHPEKYTEWLKICLKDHGNAILK